MRVFSWTGADPQVLLQFPNDFRLTGKIVLDENRRTARQIFESARRLLLQNPSLFEEKALRAERESEYPVSVLGFENEQAEARYVAAQIAGLVEEGRRALQASGVRHGRVRVAYAADMRYVGQEHPVTVDLSSAVFKKRDRDAIKRHFDEVHLVRYGTNAPKERAEIVSLRASVAGMMKKPALERIAKGGRAPARAAAVSTLRVPSTFTVM